jgi:creatinine amidohydrolase
MNRYIWTVLLSLVVLPAIAAVAPAQETNPLFKESKIRNYIPHMTWQEVEQALQRTDMVIIPVGSIEQHGKHLPLGTDSLATMEGCKLLAQKTDVLIAPVVLAGLSEHHMGFPGTITLSPETFEAVIVDTAHSLIRHGFKKIMIYNGHGGNSVSVKNAVQKINQTTSATAVLLNDLRPPAAGTEPDSPAIDWHAGVGETSLMLYLTPSLVDMSRAEKPMLTLPEIAQKAQAAFSSEPNLELVTNANLFRPKDTGKKASSREMSATGVFTSGDPRTATAKQGKDEVDGFLQMAVKFIEAWKSISR